MVATGDRIPSIGSLADSLLDLLSNSIVLDGVLPYLSLSSIFALSRASRSFRSLIVSDPTVFRYLDLSRCRGAYVAPTVTRIDSGGQRWRAERMDENLTEDEFYSGPLRGVMSKFSRMNILMSVHTLILDGLASVTLDLVSEFLQSAMYNIRLLSVLQCVNLNQRKLQQLLMHICRPSRPEGTPRLRGIYVFGPPRQSSSNSLGATCIRSSGITSSEGAQLGALPSSGAHTAGIGQDPWYAPTGRVVQEGHAQRSSWEEVLQFCKGVIVFDATLCTHMHAAMEPYRDEASKDYLLQHKPGIPPLATVALGPEGCSGCGCAPPSTPVWGEADLKDFPLLRPPPFSGKVVDAIRPPLHNQSRFIASCTWCLANRHCENCHRWWCGDCFNPRKSSKLAELERLSQAELGNPPSRDELSYPGALSKGSSSSIKVFNNLCVEHCLVGEMMAGAGSGGMWG